MMQYYRVKWLITSLLVSSLIAFFAPNSFGDGGHGGGNEAPLLPPASSPTGTPVYLSGGIFDKTTLMPAFTCAASTAGWSCKSVTYCSPASAGGEPWGGGTALPWGDVCQVTQGQCNTGPHGEQQCNPSYDDCTCTKPTYTSTSTYTSCDSSNADAVSMSGFGYCPATGAGSPQCDAHATQTVINTSLAPAVAAATDSMSALSAQLPAESVTKNAAPQSALLALRSEMDDVQINVDTTISTTFQTACTNWQNDKCQPASFGSSTDDTDPLAAALSSENAAWECQKQKNGASGLADLFGAGFQGQPDGYFYSNHDQSGIDKDWLTGYWYSKTDCTQLTYTWTSLTPKGSDKKVTGNLCQIAASYAAQLAAAQQDKNSDNLNKNNMNGGTIGISIPGNNSGASIFAGNSSLSKVSASPLNTGASSGNNAGSSSGGSGGFSPGATNVSGTSGGDSLMGGGLASGSGSTGTSASTSANTSGPSGSDSAIGDLNATGGGGRSPAGKGANYASLFGSGDGGGGAGSSGSTLNGKGGNNANLSPEVQAALDKNAITSRTIFQIVHTQYEKKSSQLQGLHEKTKIIVPLTDAKGN